ncbi:hypothetical protein Nepgr_033192 [Nepenthes gracilis]|uniref:Uncharacterized protein n=1 Tax=Nepenthes gracilis TaxID=150966 RepID=A0AAD3Y8H5_NEPGR|nr:hypothetical protein Nepgr_033192 [Nepenthes gracilis]
MSLVVHFASRRRNGELTGIVENKHANVFEWSVDAEAGDGGMKPEVLIHDDGCMEIQGVGFEARPSGLYNGAVDAGLSAAKRYSTSQLSL